MLPSDLFPRRQKPLRKSDNWHRLIVEAQEIVAHMHTAETNDQSVRMLTDAVKRLIIVLNEIVERERWIDGAENDALTGGNV